MDKTASPKPPTAADLTLDQLLRYFSTDDQARGYLEAVRWPNGPPCHPRQKTCERAMSFGYLEKETENGTSEAKSVDSLDFIER